MKAANFLLISLYLTLNYINLLLSIRYFCANTALCTAGHHTRTEVHDNRTIHREQQSRLSGYEVHFTMMRAEHHDVLLCVILHTLCKLITKLWSGVYVSRQPQPWRQIHEIVQKYFAIIMFAKISNQCSTLNSTLIVTAGNTQWLVQLRVCLLLFQDFNELMIAI